MVSAFPPEWVALQADLTLNDSTFTVNLWMQRTGFNNNNRNITVTLVNSVLGELVTRGVTDICLTPHVRAGDLAAAPPERHEAAFASLQAAAPPLPRLHRGAEVMLDRPLPVNAPGVRRYTAVYPPSTR